MLFVQSLDTKEYPVLDLENAFGLTIVPVIDEPKVLKQLQPAMALDRTHPDAFAVQAATSEFPFRLMQRIAAVRKSVPTSLWLEKDRSKWSARKRKTRRKATQLQRAYTLAKNGLTAGSAEERAKWAAIPDRIRRGEFVEYKGDQVADSLDAADIDLEQKSESFREAFWVKVMHGLGCSSFVCSSMAMVLGLLAQALTQFADYLFHCSPDPTYLAMMAGGDVGSFKLGSKPKDVWATEVKTGVPSVLPRQLWSLVAVRMGAILLQLCMLVVSDVCFHRSCLGLRVVFEPFPVRPFCSRCDRLPHSDHFSILPELRLAVWPASRQLVGFAFTHDLFR